MIARVRECQRCGKACFQYSGHGHVDHHRRTGRWIHGARIFRQQNEPG
jgi:hypothetical protein